MQFQDKVVLITGAGHSLGLDMAHRFASAGATVVIAEINAAAGERAAADIVAEGGKALAIPVDVADEAQVAALVSQTIERCGQIEILVNNAGAIGHRLLIDMPLAEWDRQIAVQLTGPFLMTKYVARHMIEHGIAGRVINISSMAAVSGRPRGGGHSASKSGLTMLTKVYAQELGPYGITVNAVAPGLVETRTQREELNTSDDYRNRYLAEVPLGRLGQPSDVSHMVMFLAQPETSWVTGQLLFLDGGVSTGHFSFGGTEDLVMLYGTGMGKATP